MAKATNEQKEIAKKLNIKFHPNISAANLQARIEQQPIAYKRDAMKHVSQTPTAPVFDNTVEQVEEAIKEYTTKGLKATFPGDGTWQFSFRGAEECGNLKIPLRVIVMKAANVSKGARLLKTMGKDGTYKGYADTILA